MAKKRIVEGVTSNDPKTKRWRSLFSAARMAYGEQKFKEAESLLARAALIAAELPESSFALNTTEIASAAIYIADKRRREAAKKLDKCVRDLESFTDSFHKELLAVALRFRAQTLSEEGKERDAETELKRSIDILTNLGHNARVQLAYSLCDLGGLLVKQERYLEGQNHMLKSMKILSEELGTESGEYTRSDMIYQLSMPMTEDSRMEFASDAIERMQYRFGGHHPSITRAVNNYLKVLHDRGDKAKLEEAIRKFDVVDYEAKTKV